MTFTREQIIAWAREANIKWNIDANWLIHYHADFLERFAALIEQAARAEERERCIDLVAMHGGPVDLEAAIRALGGKQV